MRVYGSLKIWLKYKQWMNNILKNVTYILKTTWDVLVIAHIIKLTIGVPVYVTNIFTTSLHGIVSFISLAGFALVLGCFCLVNFLG